MEEDSNSEENSEELSEDEEGEVKKGSKEPDWNEEDFQKWMKQMENIGNGLS